MKIVKLKDMGTVRSAHWHEATKNSAEFRSIISAIKGNRLRPDEGLYPDMNALECPKELKTRAAALASVFNHYFQDEKILYCAGTESGGAILTIKPGSPWPKPTPGKRKPHASNGGAHHADKVI